MYTPLTCAPLTCAARRGQWVCSKAHAQRLLELLRNREATAELLHPPLAGLAEADWLGGVLVACMLLGGWVMAVSEALFSSCLLLPVQEAQG